MTDTRYHELHARFGGEQKTETHFLPLDTGGRYTPRQALCGKFAFQKEHSAEPTCSRCAERLKEWDDDIEVQS